MTRKASNVVDMPDSAASAQTQSEAKITYNIRLGDQSVTIRTNSVEELVTLRDELSQYLPLAPATPPTPDPYFKEGDACVREGCDGKLHLKTGSKDGKSWRFWGCDSFPKCRFTSRA